MGALSLSDLFHVGIDILKTTVSAKTKTILAQLGNANGEGLVDADNAEWVQHVGFASRPAKVEMGKKAAKAYGFRSGGTDYIVASQDLRGLEIYGNLAEGETCLYATGADGQSQGRILLKDNGSVTIYSKKGNTSSGTGMMMQLDAANGAIRLVNDKGYGLIIDSDGVKLFTDGACLTLGPKDAKMIATGVAQVDGSNVALGALPLPGVGALLTGVTGIAGKASLKCSAE